MMHIAVVGGGAAGMMAAIAAGQAGARVTLLEGNEKLGKKVYITGKGRCNLTNAADRDEFLRNYPRNPRFLYSCFAGFDNRALMSLVEGAGVPLKVERGGRVFPASDKASDVTRALETLMRRAGVQVELRARVREITPQTPGFLLTLHDGRTLRADRVILCCGGASYPSTGSDGAGYELARSLGHAIVPVKPVLIPVLTREDWCRQLQGLSLKNVVLTARLGKKTLYSELGEMLFTHFGLSGPLVLSMSCCIADADLSRLEVYIDLKPGLTREQLDRRLMRDLEERSRAQLRSVLDGLLPRSLTPVVARLSEAPEDTPVNQVTRAQRDRIAATLKALPVHVTGFRPLAEAIVTRGGVSVKDVDPKTMQSRRTPGLYFAGEMLDVDGYTGGFNLQAAFSTGHCAGRSAATQEEE